MIILPPGWTAEQLKDDIALVHAPNKSGMVTIDYTRRVFMGGYWCCGPATSDKQYKGRGWKIALEADAVNWLSAILHGDEERR